MTSIIPELLNARNDFAVFLGITIIIAIIVLVFMYQKMILKWLGFDKDQEEKKQEEKDQEE